MKKILDYIKHKCDFKENEHGTTYSCGTCGRRYVPPHYAESRQSS